MSLPEVSVGGQLPSLFDIRDFYESNGGTFSCDQAYEITLILQNQCSEEEFSQNAGFYLHCDNDIVIDYPDVLNCESEQADILIDGQNNCLDCETIWSPANFLDDPTIPYPTILGSRNVIAINQEYTITAMNDLGCKEQDIVNLISLVDPPILSGTITEDFCTYQLSAEVSIPSDFDSIGHSIIFRNDSTGEEFEGEIVERSQNFSKYTLSFSKREVSSGDWVAIFNIDDSYSTNCIELVVDIGSTENTQMFFGPYRFYMPNLFGPGLGPNSRTFYPTGLARGIRGNMNAYRGRLRVFNRQGVKVHEETVSSPDARTSIDGKALEWDGRYKGKEQNSDVYIYILYLENCDNEFSNSGDCEQFCRYTGGRITCTTDNTCPDVFIDNELKSGKCIGCEFTGDINLVR